MIQIIDDAHGDSPQIGRLEFMIPELRDPNHSQSIIVMCLSVSERYKEMNRCGRKRSARSDLMC